MSMSSGKNLPHALPPENAAKVYLILYVQVYAKRLPPSAATPVLTNEPLHHPVQQIFPAQRRGRVNAGCQTLYRILRLKNPQNIQNDVTTSCPNHARQGRDQGGSAQPASEPAFFFRRSSKESTIFSCWQRT